VERFTRIGSAGSSASFLYMLDSDQFETCSEILIFFLLPGRVNAPKVCTSMRL
jgi:hypothetical protein